MKLTPAKDYLNHLKEHKNTEFLCHNCLHYKYYWQTCSCKSQVETEIEVWIHKKTKKLKTILIQNILEIPKMHTICDYWKYKIALSEFT